MKKKGYLFILALAIGILLLTLLFKGQQLTPPIAQVTVGVPTAQAPSSISLAEKILQSSQAQKETNKLQGQVSRQLAGGQQYLSAFHIQFSHPLTTTWSEHLWQKNRFTNFPGLKMEDFQYRPDYSRIIPLTPTNTGISFLIRPNDEILNKFLGTGMDLKSTMEDISWKAPPFDINIKINF